MAKAPLPRCIPIRTVSESNLREHWRKRAKRTQEARRFTGKYLHAFYAQVPELPVTITLTRIAPRALDDDNLRSALKAVRDGVTDWLRLKNDANPGLTWQYDQRKGKPREYAVAVDVQRNLHGKPQALVIE